MGISAYKPLTKIQAEDPNTKKDPKSAIFFVLWVMFCVVVVVVVAGYMAIMIFTKKLLVWRLV